MFMLAYSFRINIFSMRVNVKELKGLAVIK
jgi:hypothetical protein